MTQARIVIPGCTLEIHERGVIYVHGPEGVTLLRIEGLPTPIPDPRGLHGPFPRMLDVHYREGVVDWPDEQGDLDAIEADAYGRDMGDR
jgi:hypothetical protein